MTLLLTGQHLMWYKSRNLRLLWYLKLPYNYTQNSFKNFKEKPRIHNYIQSVIDIFEIL